MMGEDFALIGISIVLAGLYFIFGFGAAKMLAKLKGREPRILDFILWWVALVVFAVSNDIAE